MPESKNNFVVQDLTGTFAGIGTFHNRGRKTFLRKIRAKPSVPDSKEQIAVKKRFAEYVQYAKAAIKDPDIKAAYAAVGENNHSASRPVEANNSDCAWQQLNFQFCKCANYFTIQLQCTWLIKIKPGMASARFCGY